MTGTPSSPTNALPDRVQATLSQLRDIHLPDPVSLWPLAPGYYLLSVILLALLFAIGWAWYRWRKQRWRKTFRLQLRQIVGQFRATGDYRALAEQINVLVKQTLRARKGLTQPGQTPADPASLTGDAWLRYLLSTCPSLANDQATADALQPLATATYQKQPAFDADALVAAIETWGNTCP